MVQRFPMSWDRTLRITTALLVVLMAGVGLGVPAVAWRAAGGDPTDALGPFQLYAPRSGPHWLLRTAEGPVVVVPDEPGALERWARDHAGAPPE